MPFLSFTSSKKKREDVMEFKEESAGNVNGLNGVKEDEVRHVVNYGRNERKVLVIYTGGTIGMVDNKEGFLIPEKNVFESLVRRYPQLHDNTFWEKRVNDDPVFDKSLLVLPKTKEIDKRIFYKIYEYETLLDSTNMTESNWITIAEDIKKYYEKYDGFVVLHGTDTLCYTASALSFMFENIGKAVVLTGSQIPIFEPRSDGVDNFVSSLFIAGGLNIPEVTIFFASKLFRGNRTRKISTNNLYAFESPNCVPLVEVGINFEVNKAAIFKPNVIEKFTVNAQMCRNVGLLRIFPSISTAVIKAFCQPPIEGVVLESYGAGNIPTNRPDVLEVIKGAVDRGVIVVIITQCSTGAVSAIYETGKLIAQYGVICGADMTPEAALTKLSYVLTKKELSYKEKCEIMARNIRGELTNMASMVLEDQTLKEALAKGLNIQSPKKLTEVTEKVITSLLLYGIQTEDLGVVQKLLEMGADVNAQSSDGKTPLHEAILKGNLHIVEFLLKNGANVHTKTTTGEIPLMTAIYKDDLCGAVGQTPACKTEGCWFDSSSRSGEIPLMTAIQKDCPDTVSLLMKCGAHLATCQRLISEMVTVAVKNCSLKRMQTLKMAGADLDVEDELLQTPLHKAVLYNCPEIVQFLTSIGVERDKKDILKHTPLDYATALERFDLVEILNK